MDVAAIYHATIMERARHPRHHGRLAAPDALAEARNPLCGDRLSLHVALGPDGRIGAVMHLCRACAIATAATDLMVDCVTGHTPAEAAASAAAFAAALRGGSPLPAGSPLACFQPLVDTPSRISCALLGWEALGRALAPNGADGPG